jgi:hypothetical protein
MRALQFRAFGDPAAQLALVNLPDPQLRRGWAAIRIRAASVNPSDVKNVEGQMEGTVLPRVPGRDFSGVVETGAPANSVALIRLTQAARRRSSSDQMIASARTRSSISASLCNGEGVRRSRSVPRGTVG